MGNMLGCMKAKADELPQIKITVKSSCCNTHTVTFYTEKKDVHNFLTDSLKRYAKKDMETDSSETSM